MDDVLKQILNKLDAMDNRFDAMDNRFDAMDNRFDTLQKGQERIEKKLDAVYEHTADLTEFRTSTSGNLIEIRKDVSFIKHKIHQNEEENFDIKTCIKLVK